MAEGGDDKVWRPFSPLELSGDADNPPGTSSSMANQSRHERQQEDEQSNEAALQKVQQRMVEVEREMEHLKSREKARIDEIVTENERELKSKMEELKGQLESQTVALKEQFESQKEQLESQKEQLESQKEQLESQKEQLESQLAELNRKMAELNRKMAELSQKMAQLPRQFDGQIAQLTQHFNRKMFVSKWEIEKELNIRVQAAKDPMSKKLTERMNLMDEEKRLKTVLDEVQEVDVEEEEDTN